MKHRDEWARYKRTVAPTLSPVTVPEAKVRCQIDGDDTVDSEIQDLIDQAVARIEKDAHWQFMTQTWQLNLDRFPCYEIEIRRCPVQSISTVKYIANGVLTTLDSAYYQSDLISAPARLCPVYGSVWPSEDCETLNAVQVTFIAGYTSAALVPHDEKAVVLEVVKMLWYGCADSEAYWNLIRGMTRFGFIG